MCLSKSAETYHNLQFIIIIFNFKPKNNSNYNNSPTKHQENHYIVFSVLFVFTRRRFVVCAKSRTAEIHFASDWTPKNRLTFCVRKVDLWFGDGPRGRSKRLARPTVNNGVEETLKRCQYRLKETQRATTITVCSRNFRYNSTHLTPLTFVMLMVNC